MNNLVRTNCVICNNRIKNIHKLDKFPIKLETNISTNKYLYEELSFSICTSCNTIQLDKLVPLEELYNTSHNTEIVGNTWLKYYDLFKSIINLYIEDKNILEVGCPSGKIAKLCNNFNKWYIVDINKHLDVEKNNIFFIQDFFENNFLLNDNIDIIIHSHLFEHIYEPNIFLRKCYKILPNNGKMIFGIPNMEHMVDKTLFMGVFFEHNIFYNCNNISYLLKKNGFNIININYYEKHSIIIECIKTVPNTNITNDNNFKLQNYLPNFTKLINLYKNFINICNLIICNNIPNKKFIFGASYNTQFLLFNGLNYELLDNILDNSLDKQNKYFYGTKLKILNPTILENLENPIIILNNGYYSNEICLQLYEINNSIIFIKYK
jgi:predicted SAM-dependent methyltransferase